MKEAKTYYVECIGYSTVCFSYKDALELYSFRKRFEPAVKLTHDDGRIIYEYRSKDYEKNYF